jgi:hypothetical protein
MYMSYITWSILTRDGEAYDRNSDFKGTPVILPDPLSPHWPIAGFKHPRPEHKTLLPQVTLDQQI